MPSSAGQTIIQLRVTLEEVEPLVWRRLLVPGNAKLAKLHDMVQVAMGWTNSHLHQFRSATPYTGCTPTTIPSTRSTTRK